MTDWGALAAARLDELARISEPGPGVTRLPYTAEHRAAIDRLSSWMRDAGLSVHLDDAGTLVGRREGPAQAGTFYMGSHQDSVRQGGAFDGIMGVVLPLVALDRLLAEGTELPFAVEILAFADEEGVRFPTALTGSRALAGAFDPDTLSMTDREGISLHAALQDFGLDPRNIPALARDRGQALGYLETHIEQGPVLERAGEALGVVTAICGIERHQVTLRGTTGHAGTLPMEGRQDALVGAAEIVTAVNALARRTPDLRATVGELNLLPNVVNAVPGEVRMTVELRAPQDMLRKTAGETLGTIVAEAAEHAGLEASHWRSYSQPAQACDAGLMARLKNAVAATGGTGMCLPSGATHDASAMADLCPIAMLFVRCEGGVSHAPEEYASPRDLGLATEALCSFLRGLAGDRPEI